MITVDVIIPTLNEVGTIGYLIQSLTRDPYPLKEIVVVDGGSTDGTLEIARIKQVKVIKEAGQKSPANAINQGVRESHSDVVCLLDGDYAWVSDGFITNSMGYFDDARVAGVSGRIEVIQDTLMSRIQQSARDSFFSRLFGGELAKSNKLTIVKKRVQFLRRKTFDDIGGYPMLGYGEDGVFLRKLNDFLVKNPDIKIIDDTSLVVYVRRTSSLKELFKGRAWYGRTMIPYFKKASLGASFKSFLFAVPLIYLASMISIPLAFISSWFLIPAIPYLLKIMIVLSESAIKRDKYRLLTPVLDFVAGVGHLTGLLQYLIGKRKLSRG